MVQIRERDLSAREIFYVAKAIADSSAGARTQILVNDRADIAQSAGAGVHLRADSLSVDVVRAAFGTDMLVGVSTHTYSELSEAEKSGADFAVFGPVFETASKKEYGEPVGLEALRKVTAHLTIPVFALGGLNLSNFREALDAGAAGIAGISMFSETQDLGSLVATIKRHGQPGR
jgi:thiamine-phosphate pyrophosphorylase